MGNPDICEGIESPAERYRIIIIFLFETEADTKRCFRKRKNGYKGAG
jgi:hypothetical protein